MSKGVHPDPTIFDLLRENALADNDVLHKKDAMGDLFDRSRDVDFAFKTPEAMRAEDLCKYLKGMNFGTPFVREGEDGVYWVITVIHMPINQPVICSVSAFMVCLSRLFGVDFDGWGSVVQSS